MEQIKIITPQFERTTPLEFEHKPTNNEEFYNLVNNAPYKILKGFGFGKWDSMNNIIKENIKDADRPKMVSIPTYELNDVAGIIQGEDIKPSGDMLIELGCKQPTPIKLLEPDEDILLFPGEWYDVIPNGFIVTGLYGEQYPFEKGKSDDDIRYGCLPYGIRRPIELPNLEEVIEPDTSLKQ